MTRFYALDPATGRQIDVTSPVSTDGLDLKPEITPETLINLWDADGNLIGTRAVKDLPVPVSEVRKVLDKEDRP